MMFYSTNDKSHRVDLKTAVLSGLAPDGGLYMPESIPKLDDAFFARLPTLTLSEIGYEVVRPFVEATINDRQLRQIMNETLTFDIPLVRVDDQHVLELFHGPTLAFKDVGARFMARLMAVLLEGDERELTILVATSGDTGSAVAHGFYRVPGVRVIILFPKGKVSPFQEQQMTSLGENIMTIAVEGTFDDCQRLVKEAFLRKNLSGLPSAEFYERTTDPSPRLGSANSINIARLLPQMIYYFWACALQTATRIFCVPSGNFGNLTAGLMAKRMGLPVKKFIAATNANDVIPEYLETSIYRPRPSISTISNAMDVGSPSNFARILALYPALDDLREDVIGRNVTDQQTRETIASVYKKTRYLLDPHTAVGFSAIRQLGLEGIVLATAHPKKFQESIKESLGSVV